MAISSTSFSEGNKHSAKPRKRKTFSEAALLAAAERKGDGALLFYEELFEVKESEDGSKDYVLKERNDEKIKLSDRINAANAWSKLVFIQPKEEDSEAELNGKEVVMLKILFDLISPYLPSDKMNEIREKFYTMVSNASSGN